MQPARHVYRQMSIELNTSAKKASSNDLELKLVGVAAGDALHCRPFGSWGTLDD